MNRVSSDLGNIWSGGLGDSRIEKLVDLKNFRFGIGRLGCLEIWGTGGLGNLRLGDLGIVYLGDYGMIVFVLNVNQ